MSQNTDIPKLQKGFEPVLRVVEVLLTFIRLN